MKPNTISTLKAGNNGLTRNVAMTVYSVNNATLICPDNAVIKAPINAKREIKSAGVKARLGKKTSVARVKLIMPITLPVFGKALLFFVKAYLLYAILLWKNEGDRSNFYAD